MDKENDVPPVDNWKVEMAPIKRSDVEQQWTTLCENASEAEARQTYAEVEGDCQDNKRGLTEVKLWQGDQLVRHSHWNRRPTGSFIH